MNKNEFTPKLSKHELILERYKTILTHGRDNLDLVSSNNNKIENRKSFDIDNILINKSKSEYLNKMNLISNFQTSGNNVNYDNKINDSSSNLDYLEKIKSKYLNSNNSNDIKMNNFITNEIKSLNNTNLGIASLMNPNNEIEMIKSKYLNKNKIISNVNLSTTNTIRNNNTNFEMESKLLKYKQINKDINIENTNNILNIPDTKIKEENSQSSPHKINNSQPNSLLKSRISLIEEQINKLNSLTTDPKIIDKEELMNKIRNIVEISSKRDATNNSLNDSLNKNNKSSIYSDTELDEIKSIEDNILNIKKLKKINNLKLINNQNKKIKDNNNDNNNTNEILNNLIENITGELFNKNKSNFLEYKSYKDNSIIMENSENDNEIIIMPKNKTKIFKLRASSTPKKKLQKFEDFIKNE